MDGSQAGSFRTEVPDELVERFAARAAAYDRSGDIALDNIEDLRRAGFLALALPRAKGGAAIDLRQMVEIISKVARGDPSTALILAMQYLQSGAVAQSQVWPDPVKDEVFTTIVRDGALINALRVEPDLGTPARGGIPATRIKRVDGVWRLSGRKIFSTGSLALTWGIVWSATDEPEPRVGQVLVPLDLPGVTIEKSWHQLGMRATGSHTIVFDDAAVPDRYLVNLVPSGAESPEPPVQAAWHAVVVAALYDAIARSGRDWLISFLKTRVPSALGRPLSTLPAFHTVLGKIDGLLLTNEALIEQALSRKESGVSSGAEAGQIKRLVTENAIAAVAGAVEVTGNPGLSQDNPLERHYRNVLCGRIHTPQADVVLEAAGRAALME
ncbi:acyl-CoA dehydrogenase family protein [Acetobacter oeni]|uniref:Acyl-CoA dehydrogenase n=1 Tax=Acetobacter oeni TaxID=304077 RepID=A0A511XMC9_9PROT|nr:acyl-CoA dehydrogenase family protein [Acetobacter oeni]MBB3883700.1 alkylation response protein AidB-like acyl-CoA dehydrogenase [Acetobacter oeni]NHO19719.1 acyl-CoA dehydrogenase [Acetobacter oeni]GBR02824.1 acyl-CoA dehydrogenase [Acetobacter oeni LMG 21952]GEN64102.1 acyl-CoA dehydrogenase [Acetobacter oeni]